MHKGGYTCWLYDISNELSGGFTHTNKHNWGGNRRYIYRYIYIYGKSGKTTKFIDHFPKEQEFHKLENVIELALITASLSRSTRTPITRSAAALAPFARDPKRPRMSRPHCCGTVSPRRDAAVFWHGYGSIPINTIFRGMNIHLPPILMFTRGTRFWHTATWMCKTYGVHDL